MPETRWTVFELLDKLELRHERRISARGTPYAGFRLAVAGAGEAAFTAIIEHAVCRLTVHGICPAGTGPDGWETLQRGARLPMGAAYRSPDDGSLELSLGLRLREDAALNPSVLQDWLRYAHQAAAALRADDAWPRRPALPFQPAGAPALQRALAAQHLDVKTDGIETWWQQTLDATRLARIGLRESADGWAQANGQALPPITLQMNAACEATLQRLQRWSSAGRFVFSPDTGALDVEVVTPNLGAPLPALLWSATQAQVMLVTASKHLATA